MRTVGLLLLAFPNALAAQGDSLLGVWNDTSQPDSARLKALHTHCRNVLEPATADSAYHLALVQHAFAKRVNASKYEAKALMSMGIAMVMKGDVDSALALHRNALAITSLPGLEKERAICLYNLGVDHIYKGEIARTDSCMRASLAISRRIGDLESLAATLYATGRRHERQGDLDSALQYYAECMGVARKLDDRERQVLVHNDLASVYKQQGDMQRAIDALSDALAIAEKDGDLVGESKTLMGIGSLYGRQKEPERALIYYDEALAKALAADDAPAKMSAYMSRANILEDLGRLDEAMVEMRKSRDVAEAASEWRMVALADVGLSNELLKAGRPEEALERAQAALALEQKIDYTKGIAGARIAIGNAWAALKRWPKAVEEARQALAQAEAIGNVEQQSEALELLWHGYRALGDTKGSLDAYERHIALRDSLEREENQRAVLRQEYRYTYQQQALADSLSHAAAMAVQAQEVQKQKLMRNGFMGGFALVALFAGVFFVQRNRISKARKRSDELLLNILPEEVAEELKDTGAAQAKHFDTATILFTDFKGFTQLSEQVTPAELVEELNTCFKAFDAIVGRHRIEKIKTIGDAYMAAGGLPDPQHGSPADVVRAALEMQDFMKAHKTERTVNGKPYFEMRLGIHTGPVVAGIVGVKKFQYDIWGDTVNTAARMESSGEVGQVNISEATHALVRNEPRLSFTPRGKVQAKGKGELEMYFVGRSGEAG